MQEIFVLQDRVEAVKQRTETKRAAVHMLEVVARICTYIGENTSDGILGRVLPLRMMIKANFHPRQHVRDRVQAEDRVVQEGVFPSQGIVRSKHAGGGVQGSARNW